MASGLCAGGEGLGRMMIMCPKTFRTGSVAPTPSLARSGGNIKNARNVVVHADANAEDSFSGEWPMNWSLASYEDLGGFYEREVLKEEGMGGYSLEEIMSADVMATTPEATIASIMDLFEQHTGLPVLDPEGRLIGIVSRRDIEKGGALVKDIMSSPPIAAKPSSRVADAACLMLKHKVHRIPVVDKSAKVVGIVTRTDIFQALEAEADYVPAQ